MKTNQNYNARLSRKLLVFAVIFEAVAVIAGLALAGGALYEALETATGFSTVSSLNAALGAIPFVLVAISEAAKIPLTYSFFNASNVVWKTAIGGMLIAIAVITFETAVSGFERAYTVRAADVEDLQHKMARIDRKIARKNQLVSALRDQRTRLIEQLNKVDKQELREIEQHTERCKAVGAGCASRPYIDEIRRASEAKRAPLRDSVKGLGERLAELSTSDLDSARAEVQTALIAAANSNQIYRLAARIYGKSVENVTLAETAFVGKIWFGSIGIIVALTGIVIAAAAALLDRPTGQAGKLTQMLRLALLRLRKRARVEIVRTIEVPGPERIVTRTVEKPVVRERKILVYVPKGYDLRGIGQASFEGAVEAQLSEGAVTLIEVGAQA